MQTTIMGLQIPPEILEKIFSYLDGRTLIRVSQVDKTWNHEVKRLAKTLDRWRSLTTEIPKAGIIELTTNLDLHLPLVHSDSLPEASLLRNWYSVYMNWWLWKQISKWPTSVSGFATGETVTSVKLSGCCIVTGHSSGEIRVWNFEMKLLAISRTHERSVDNLLLVALGSDYKFENFEWCKTYPRVNLGLAHHCVISTSEDQQLAVTYFVGSYLSSGIVKLHQPDYLIEREILISGDLSMVAVARVIPTTANILVLINDGDTSKGQIYNVMLGPECKLELNLEMTFQFPGYIFSNAISCYPPKTVAAVIATPTSRLFYWIDLDKEIDNCNSTLLCSHRVFMQDAKIFRANICIWIENSFTTLLHIDTNDSNRITYEVRPSLPAVPVSFHLHGPILVMGTTTGSLIAFDASKLPELDLAKPLWTKHLDCGPIKAIHTLGSHHDLRLVAVGKGSLKCVKVNTSHCMPFLPVEVILIHDKITIN